MKVLDFQKQQPEFKTPVWDYVDGLVDDDRVADGKAAMAREARALARAEEKYGVSRYMLAAIWGVESNFGQEMGKRPLVQSLTTLACYRRARRLFPLRTDGDAEDHRPRRRAGREAQRLVGGRVRADAVHALDLPAPRGRLRGRRAARHRRFGAGRARLDRQLSRASRAGAAASPGASRSSCRDGYSGPSGRKAKQSMSFWAARGVTRIDGRPLRRGRRRAAHAGGTRRAGLSGDAQFRRRLFL